MAIIIPSRSIYKKDNPKVRDNLVNKIELNAVEITPNNEYEVGVFNGTIQDFSNLTQESYENLAREAEGSDVTKYKEIVSFIRIIPKYLNYKVQIARYDYNKYISKVYLGTKFDEIEEKNVYNIKCRIIYDKYDGNASGIVNYYPSNESLVLSNFKYSFSNKPIETSQQVEETFSPTIEYTYTTTHPTFTTTNISVTSKISNFENKTDLKGTNYKEDRYGISFDVNILVGYDIITMGGENIHSLSNYTSEDINMSGLSERYMAKQIELTINGDTIGVKSNDKTITIGEGNKPLSFEGNELMQTTNYLKEPINGESKAVEYLYGNTLNSFLKGKETATIRCSVVDYKDENDNVVVRPNSDKPIFEQYDEVIPMAYGSNEPMSRYNDGNAKVFVVLANKLSRKGVCWQELTLQEKNATLAGLYNKVYDLIASWDTLGMSVESDYGYDDYINNNSNPTNVLTKKSSGVKLVIANNITKIGNYAFQNCKTLTSVEIPNSVTRIGGGAFNGCTSLISIELPNSIASISWDTFYDCTSLKNIKIPTSVTSIGANAFQNCKTLTSVEIPNSVTGIGDYAFRNCSKLKSITIPNSVTSIGKYAFDGCDELTIYCEAESNPSGWNSNWNIDNRPVVWGYKP